MTLMIRTVVFVDYEDCILKAKQIFHLPHACRAPLELDPLKLATRLSSEIPGRHLKEIRIYRSVPDANRDIVGFGYVIGQIERWREAGVTVVRRPEKKGTADPHEAGQKALVVAMAVDLVVMAVEDRFDLGVVCSSDCDLAPAVSAVLDHSWKTIEVAAWRADLGPSPRLRVAGEDLHCHWIGRSTFEDLSIPTQV
jgi:uncharacterized LabA/DUF88 family protein